MTGSIRRAGPRAPSDRLRRHTRTRRLLVGCERLEELTLLSAYLYIDYGDNFANGTLQGSGVTTDALVSHTASGGVNINGPQLTDSAGKNYAAGTTFLLNSFSSFYGASAATMRQTIDALVQRAYAPFDVTVMDLTAAGTTVNGKTVAAAASLDDESKTLAASGDGHDSYVFVAQAIINGTVADNTHDPTQFAKHGYGGIASVLDFNNNLAGNNTHDGTALALLRSDYGVNKLSQTIAHEAGHLFGLTHTWRSDAGVSPDPRVSVGAYRAQLDQYSSSDMMSYTSFSGFSLFSRLPEVADQASDDTDNTNTTVLNASPTPYDHFKADAGVGASNVEYVTGSGANDIITITKAGPTTATVTVQPFTDTAYTAANAINIPGQATATYTYTINTNVPVIVDGGNGLDRFVIDGDLGTTVTVRADSYSGDPAGAFKGDALVILGKGAASGTYTPGTNSQNSGAGGSDLRGSVTIGTTRIDFQEFSTNGSVTVSDVTNFTYTTPSMPTGGSGGNDLTIGSPAAGQNEITGTTSGVNLVPFVWSDDQNFTVDTATNDASSPDDTVTLDAPLVATGLKNFTINTGAGDDLFTANANFALPVAGGAFTYNSGTQATTQGDNLVVNATGTSAGAFNPDGNTANNGTFTEDGTNLQTTSLERGEVDGFTNFTLTTPNDADVMTISPDLANTNSPDENMIAGSSGGVGFSTLSFYKTTNFTIDSLSKKVGGLRGDSYTVNNSGGAALQASGLQNFTINSGPGNDVLTVNADDLRLPVAGGLFTFDAGTGAYGDGTAASNLRGLISLDRIVVNADVDYLLADGGTTLSDGTPIPDRTTSSGQLSIAPAGSGAAAGASLGSLRLIGVESATLTGGPGNNRMDASGFSGSVVLRGGAGNDTLIGGSSDNDLDGGEGDDTLYAGSDSFARPGLGSQANVLLGGGGTNIVRGGPGRNTFYANLNGTATLLGGGDDDTFIITNPTGTVTAPVGGITIDGGGQPGDTLKLIGGGGPTYNQVYMVGPAAGQGQIVTTNNYNRTGPTISQFVRFSGLAAVDDSLTADRLSIMGASASAPIDLASGTDLGSGQLRLTVGGAPFAAITFVNKTNLLVLASGGRVITAAAPAVQSPVSSPVTITTSTPVARPTPLITVSAPAPDGHAPAPSIQVVAGTVAPPTGGFPNPAPAIIVGPVSRRFSAARRSAGLLGLHHQATPNTGQRGAHPFPKGPLGHRTTVKTFRPVSHGII